MYIYRPHRYYLADSLAEAREFETKEEMLRWIAEDSAKLTGKPLFDESDIVIDDESAANDERTGWRDTMYVCVKRFGNEDYMKLYSVPQCIGMCATNYEDNAI